MRLGMGLLLCIALAPSCLFAQVDKKQQKRNEVLGKLLVADEVLVAAWSSFDAELKKLHECPCGGLCECSLAYDKIEKAAIKLVATCKVVRNCDSGRCGVCLDELVFLSSTPDSRELLAYKQGLALYCKEIENIDKHGLKEKFRKQLGKAVAQMDKGRQFFGVVWTAEGSYSSSPACCKKFMASGAVEPMLKADAEKAGKKPHECGK